MLCAVNDARGCLKVLNLIKNPPADNSYQHLKDRVLYIITPNDYAHAEAFACLPLQPSTLMSRMLGLLPTGHLGEEYPPMQSTHLSFLELLLLPLQVPVLAVLLLFPQPLAVPAHPPCAGTMETWPRSVKLPAPGWETSRLGGGCVLPSCQSFRFFPHLPPGSFLFLEASSGFWSLCILVSLSTFNLQLQ